jgi:hypothetical protein
MADEYLTQVQALIHKALAQGRCGNCNETSEAHTILRDEDTGGPRMWCHMADSEADFGEKQS